MFMQAFLVKELSAPLGTQKGGVRLARSNVFGQPVLVGKGLSAPLGTRQGDSGLARVGMLFHVTKGEE